MGLLDLICAAVIDLDPGLGLCLRSSHVLDKTSGLGFVVAMTRAAAEYDVGDWSPDAATPIKWQFRFEADDGVKEVPRADD